MRGSILLLVVCAFAVGVLGDRKIRSSPREAMEKCFKELGVDKEVIHKIHESYKNGEEPDQKIKCFEACMGRETGIIVDGKPIVDKIIESIPADIPDRDKIIETITKCSEESGNDECETAYLVGKCLHENKVMPPPPHHHHHHHHDD